MVQLLAFNRISIQQLCFTLCHLLDSLQWLISRPKLSGTQCIKMQWQWTVLASIRRLKRDLKTINFCPGCALKITFWIHIPYPFHLELHHQSNYLLCCINQESSITLLKICLQWKVDGRKENLLDVVLLEVFFMQPTCMHLILIVLPLATSLQSSAIMPFCIVTHVHYFYLTEKLEPRVPWRRSV